MILRRLVTFKHKLFIFSDFNNLILQSKKLKMPFGPEISEQLHTEAGIDYTHSAIYRNLSVAQLYEHALQNEPGTVLSSTGALITSSGQKKGRSPKDKRIVDEANSTKDIWVSFANLKFLSFY
jgi:phosphoenolpyruvate carboxykinase (ATP)